MCDHLEFYRERLLQRESDKSPSKADTASAAPACLASSHSPPPGAGGGCHGDRHGSCLARGLKALQRHQASGPALPHLLLSQKGGAKASDSPKGALGLRNENMLGHAGIFSTVTAASGPPTTLDLQGHKFVTLRDSFQG